MQYGFDNFSTLRLDPDGSFSYARQDPRHIQHTDTRQWQGRRIRSRHLSKAPVYGVDGAVETRLLFWYIPQPEQNPGRPHVSFLYAKLRKCDGSKPCRGSPQMGMVLLGFC